MKKLTSLLLTGVMALSLAGCGSDTTTTTTGDTSTTTETSGDVVSIALLLPYVGDQSYFDVTNNGLKLVEEQFPGQVSTKLIEMGRDSAAWSTANLQAASEGTYDIIISGNFEYEPYMIEVAAQFPEIAYINFDYSDAQSNIDAGNIYGMTYKGEEMGYLAGVVAAVKSETGIVGAIGGQENPSIQNMVGGFVQGALAVNPDIKVLTGYVGDFSDTAKAKEIASNMYDQGADIIWQSAGGAGNGVFEAASELDKWAIGVDSDQYASLSAKPEIASHILTSSLKKCDAAILNAITLYFENGNTLPFGEMVSMGLKEGAVGLVKNEVYTSNLTEEQQATVSEFEDKLINGEIQLIDVLADPTQYQGIIDSAA